MAITTNTANTTVTDRTASGNQPDNTPATGTTTGGSGGSGVSSVSSGSSNVTVTSSGGGGTGAVTISVSTNTVLNGTTAPASGTGNVGDFYINTTNETIYGPKNSSGTPWGSPTSLIGPTGATGANGTNGTNGTNGATWYTGTGSPSGVVSGNAGDLYLDTTTQNVWKCVSGTNWGSVPIANIKGATGATGATGSTGAAGTPGSVWYSGAGTPSSGTGINGDYYLNTSNGDVFLKVSGSWGTRIENLTGPAGTGSGTVTSVSVTSANGFAGTVATASTTPAISLNTTVTGILKSTGTTGTPAGISAAANTDVNALFPSTPINQVYASPSSSTAGTPTFRSLVSADLPTVPYTKGGTGLTTAPTNGQLAIGNGTGYTLNTITGAGTVSVTNGSGTITITGSGSSLPSGAAQGQVLLEGASTAGWYNQSYNVTAFASLAAAITAAGSTGVLYFPTAYTIPSGTTISLPVIVEGLLTCSGTATFNGTIQAPLRQIFSGGTVSIGPNTPYIYPEWFGAAKTGSSDDQPSISAALSSVTLASGSSAPNQFVVLTGTYYLGSVLTITNSQMFKVVGGASFYPYSTYTGDCIVYQYNSNNTVTDIPTIVGFTTGAGLTLLGCNVLKATGFMIKNCKYGINIKAADGRTVLDNYVNVHFIPDCQYGVYVTDDGSGATIQGNEIYSNFYTNDNIHTNPWVTDTISKTVDNAVIGLWSVITNLGTTSQTNWNILAHTTGITYSVGSSFLAAVAVSTSGSTGTVTQYYATNIAACYWDNLNNKGWNGNKIQIKAVDINGATSSYGFYNASTNATSSYLNNWDIDCSLWFGGINSHNFASASFMTGRFVGCTARYCIQGDLGNLPWNSMSITGNTNRIIFLNGGGNWNVYPAAGQPASAFTVSTTSSRSSFSSYAPYSNRLTCKYNITSSIAAGGLLQVYVYSPLTDAVTSGGVTGGSGNIYAVPYPNSTGGTPVGLVFEAAFDNSASVANEIVLFFRNCSGSTINSGTGFFDFIVTVGL